MDGNKRTAHAAGMMFLRRNGYPLPQSERIHWALAECLAAAGHAVDAPDTAERTSVLQRMTAELAAWLREQTR